MRSESSASARSTATPSKSRRRQREPRGDEEILKRQEEDAQAALRQTFRETGRTLLHAADARTWIQQYPWLSVGSSSLLGFLLATAATPAPGEPMAEKWAHLKEGFQGRRERWRSRMEKKAVEESERSKEKAPRPTLWAILIAPLLQILTRAVAMAESKTEHVVRIVGSPVVEEG